MMKEAQSKERKETRETKRQQGEARTKERGAVKREKRDERDEETTERSADKRERRGQKKEARTKERKETQGQQRQQGEARTTEKKHDARLRFRLFRLSRLCRLFLNVIARLGTSRGNLIQSALTRRSPRSLMLARDDGQSSPSRLFTLSTSLREPQGSWQSPPKRANHEIPTLANARSG